MQASSPDSTLKTLVHGPDAQDLGGHGKPPCKTYKLKPNTNLIRSRVMPTMPALELAECAQLTLHAWG